MVNRRRFVLSMGTLANLSLLTSGTLTAPNALAQKQTASFKEGEDYLKLKQTVSTDAPAGKVEVIEFFGYFCPHCNAFEPQLEAWIRRMPANVAFKNVPVDFGRQTGLHQRLFYTLDAMGKLPELHRKVFATIHTDRNSLASEAAILDWADKQKLDTAKFKELFNSFSVAGKVKRAKQLQEMYTIDGVPSFGVAGRYYTDGTLAKSMDRALQVVETLAKS